MTKKQTDPKLQQVTLGLCAVTVGGPFLIAMGSLLHQNKWDIQKTTPADSVKTHQSHPHIK